MSYQQPPDHQAEGPAGPPPGWHLDPGGLRAVRWWDGAQWTPHTRPLPGIRQQPQPAYPGASAPGSGEYDAFHQEGTGRHRRQSEQQDDAADASFPPARPEPEPERLQEPQASPGQQADVAQQPYTPGPLPQAHHGPRRRKNRKLRGVLIGLAALIGIIVGVSVATEHNSPSAGNTAATSAAPTASTAVAASAPASLQPSEPASSPPSCDSQLLTWRSSGISNQLQAIITDLSNVSQSADSVASDLSLGNDPSADEAALQSAAASLQSDTQAAEDNLIPDCLPDAHQAESTGLADFNNSAINCENAITEISDGDDAVADGDIQAADAAMQSGSSEIGQATNDLKQYDPN
jgi:Protein of unknown function (DUF2510)